MKLGDKVLFDSYYVPTHNYYGYKPDPLPPYKRDDTHYAFDGRTNEVIGTDEDDIERYREVECKPTEGIYVGTTTIRRKMYANYNDQDHYYEYNSFDEEQVARIYYTNNRSRLVPLSSIEESDK